MNTLQKVERFIAKKKSAIDKGQEFARLMPGTMPFVTISSQSGAGGSTLAQTLLDRLANDGSGVEELQDWRLFDKEMCQHLLEEEHLAESLNELLHDDYHSQINEFVMGIFGDRGMQNVAYARLARQLRTLASVGKVIILGHGGCMATRNLAGGIHVRLVAPLPIRAARMASLLEIDEPRAMRLIRKRDSAQRKLLKTHYRVDSANSERYHLVCNTELIPPRTVATLVVSLLHKQTE